MGMIGRILNSIYSKPKSEPELGKKLLTTDWRVRNYSAELLRWGQKHKLKPDETCLYLKLCHEQIAREIGLTINT
jgi:hypothetical protein